MQPKLNISIDDVSPHPLSSLKIIEKCQKVIDIIPNNKYDVIPVGMNSIEQINFIVCDLSSPNEIIIILN